MDSLEFERLKKNLIELNDLRVSKISANADMRRSMNSIESYQDWRRVVPTFGKSVIFKNSSVLLNLGVPKKPTKFMISAGSSHSELSYRAYNQAYEASNLESILGSITKQWSLDSDCLVVNMYPSGIELSADSFSVVSCGPRPELLRKICEQIGVMYRQIILLAQPQLLEVALSLESLPREVSSKMLFLLGGGPNSTGLCDALAQYFSLGLSEVNRKVISTYGLAEIGLGIGIMLQEHHELRQVRRFEAVPSSTIPMVFAVNSDRYFCEVSDQGTILVTSLDQNAPYYAHRYDTGDFGSIERVGSKLIVLIWGRPSQSNPLSDRIQFFLSSNLRWLGVCAARFSLDDRQTLSLYEVNSQVSGALERALRQQFPELNEIKFQTSDPCSPFSIDLIRKPKYTSTST